jgi:hypothetical protein
MTSAIEIRVSRTLVNFVSFPGRGIPSILFFRGRIIGQFPMAMVANHEDSQIIDQPFPAGM